MSFKFSMQKILDYRGQLEEEAKVKLAEAQSLFLQEEKRMVSLKEQLAQMEGDLYKNLDADHASRWLLENYIKGLREDISQTTLRMRHINELVEQCRTLVIMRAKDCKVLEKLKEKQQERYHVAQKELERKINDETATLRHAVSTF